MCHFLRGSPNEKKKKVQRRFESISPFYKGNGLENNRARTHTKKGLIKTSNERQQALKTKKKTKKNQEGEINQRQRFVKMTSEKEKEMNKGGQKKGGRMV